MLNRIPWRLIGYAALALLLLFGANHALRFVPFTPQWTAARAAAKADRLEGQVSTLEREATGQAEIQTATDTYHQNTVVIREVTAAAISDARSDPDADTALSDARASRLRAHDRSLCDASPALCANADPAGSGADAL